ncbi:hypothetical protein [Kribbella sp. NPDC006257]
MLKLVNEGTCDGVHPDTGLHCVLGEHRGPHRAVDGSEWLDDE